MVLNWPLQKYNEFINYTKRKEKQKKNKHIPNKQELSHEGNLQFGLRSSWTALPFNQPNFVVQQGSREVIGAKFETASPASCIPIFGHFYISLLSLLLLQ